mgnify:CR=1 FL=1
MNELTSASLFAAELPRRLITLLCGRAFRGAAVAVAVVTIAAGASCSGTTAADGLERNSYTLVDLRWLSM